MIGAVYFHKWHTDSSTYSEEYLCMNFFLIHSWILIGWLFLQFSVSTLIHFSSLLYLTALSMKFFQLLTVGEQSHHVDFLLSFLMSWGWEEVVKKCFSVHTNTHTHTLGTVGEIILNELETKLQLCNFVWGKWERKKTVFHWSSEWCGVFLQIPHGDKVYNWIWRWGYKRKVIFHKIKIETKTSLGCGRGGGGGKNELNDNDIFENIRVRMEFKY